MLDLGKTDKVEHADIEPAPSRKTQMSWSKALCLHGHNLLCLVIYFFGCTELGFAMPIGLGSDTLAAVLYRPDRVVMSSCQ